MSNYINKINLKGTEYDIQGNITIGSSLYFPEVVTDTITLGTGLKHVNGCIDIDRSALIGTDSRAIIRISDNMIEGWSHDLIKLKVPTTPEVITKDLYYNDGSNKHVPVRHPDLATQPSILPYKFMGQYVYEQLIPNSPEGDTLFVSGNDLIVSDPLFLEACIFGKYGYSLCEVIKREEGVFEINPKTTNIPEFSRYQYYKIVYTSIPEEEDYYGYNKY